MSIAFTHFFKKYIFLKGFWENINVLKIRNTLYFKDFLQTSSTFTAST